MPTQTEKAEVFAALHARDGAFAIPNPWDVGSACLFAGMGFEALATTSSGFAATLGRGDYGVTRGEAMEHCRALAASVDIPVSADLETCFASSPEEVAETISMAIGTGLAGGSIEDFSGNRDDPILPLDEAVERVKAAVSAIKAQPVPFVLTARAENLLHGRKDMDDTIARLQAFEAAGADVLYAPGLRSLDDIKAVTSAVSKPVNVLGILVREASVADMAAAGAKRISVGGAIARAAMGEAMRCAQELLGTGTHTFMGRVPRGELDTFIAKGAAGDT
ncbi:MAG: isocitrate lyase/phosphoenolpyruvate mutase family protein [Pseudomonadota bacterium]